MFRLSLLFLLVGTFASFSFSQNKSWDITDFGAVGDGKTLNTAAIRKTIDVCSKSGGGQVRIPAGAFVSGSFILKTGVHLYLDNGTTLIASCNKDDYQIVETKNPKGERIFGENGSFFIYAENAKDISIQGKGIINGSGSAFWENEMLTDYVKKPKVWRPWGLICFVNCKNIEVQDVTLKNSPCYTLWNLGCKDIQIQGITIQNPIDGPNTDGIDIDCCRNVIIRNCNIEGGDDAVAIKSDGGRLGKNTVCKNIEVSDCTLSSPPACGVRVGYEGDAPIKNCRFNNLKITNSHHGIDIVSIVANRPQFPMKKGTRIKNIQFRNVEMCDVLQPVYIWMGTERSELKPASYIKNIRISNLKAKNCGDSFVGSMMGRSIEDLRFTNIQITPKNSFTENTPFYNNVWGSKNPHVFHFMNVSKAYLSNINIRLEETSYWKSTFYFENSQKISLDNYSITGQEVHKILPVESNNSSVK